MRLPTQPAFTTQLQKYKTKTRRVYHCPVFSLKIASLSFVIITMLNILKSPNPLSLPQRGRVDMLQGELSSALW